MRPAMAPAIHAAVADQVIGRAAPARVRTRSPAASADSTAHSPAGVAIRSAAPQVAGTSVVATLVVLSLAMPALSVTLIRSRRYGLPDQGCRRSD